ncbi:MAG: hypothetical protein ACUVQX_01485 [Candidatus Bathycorpusculaceae bacterium]
MKAYWYHIVVEKIRVSVISSNRHEKEMKETPKRIIATWNIGLNGLEAEEFLEWFNSWFLITNAVLLSKF